MKRPCVVLARPMSADDPTLMADDQGYLFAEVLRGMLAKGLASEIVLAVPDYVPAEIRKILKGWGFEVVAGADAPQQRLFEVMSAQNHGVCAVLTPYSCLVDGTALDAAWHSVESGSVDAVFTGKVVAPKSFAVMNRQSAGVLARAVSEPLPPFMFRTRLEETGQCRVMELTGLESTSEEFLWGTLFAGDVAALPSEIVSRFLRGREQDVWFSRRQFSRLLSEISGVEDFSPLEKSLASLDGTGAKLASHVHFLRKLAPHMPDRGERFLEIGCHDQPLLAALAINRFQAGIAVEPYVFSEAGIRGAKVLAQVLSEHAPTMVPLEVTRTRVGDFTGLDFRKATVEELELDDGSVDFCWSKVVFEHVEDVHSLSRELYRVLAPGAAMVHRIDFRDHGRDHEAVYINFDFLRHSREEWARMEQETNLWRVTDFVNLWQELGFEVEVLERRTRVVRPDTVHPGWEAYAEDDLYCYDALIKAVKPAGIDMREK